MDTDTGRREGEAAGDQPAAISIAEALGDLSPEALDSMCKRMTGMSLDDWAEIHRTNRARDVRRRKIDPSRPLPHDRVIEWMSLYGFDGDDFYAVQTPTEVVRRYDLNFESPVCPVTGRLAKTVLRWRLRPNIVPDVL